MTQNSHTRGTFPDRCPIHQPRLGTRGCQFTAYKHPSRSAPLYPPQGTMSSRRNTQDTLVEELIDDHFEESVSELPVTFHPPLYLQRRLWVLNILRAESVAQASKADLYRCHIITMSSSQ